MRQTEFTRRGIAGTLGALAAASFLPHAANASTAPGAAAAGQDAWTDPGIPGVKHRMVSVNGIRLHVAEQGTGPLVILCHGFPECWYSWRHQLGALANAGFRVVAPDMRGYGRSERPEATEKYTLLHHVGDMVGLVDALGESSAVIAGHDFGATVAWQAALMRPDRFDAVIALSAPFRSRGFGGTVPPTTLMPRNDNAIFYQLFLQTPEAEAALGRDTRRTFRSQFYAMSGDAPAAAGNGFANGMVPLNGAGLADPAELPAWVTPADIDVYATEFIRSGFHGALAWFRDVDLSWELMAPFAGERLELPALYIAGDRDFVVAANARYLSGQAAMVPKLKPPVMLAGCGHWTQQERPWEANAAMIRFLAEVRSARGSRPA